MGVAQNLSVLALRQVISGACQAIGCRVGDEIGEALVRFLDQRFADHSTRLTAALQKANDRAWKALEISLAGDSLWERCKILVARSEDRGFAQQVRTFLDAVPWPEIASKTAFRRMCLDELRAARKSGTLTAGAVEPRQLAQQSAAFARFADPAALLAAEWQVLAALADALKQAGHTSLAWLVSQRPSEGMPLLVVAVRYFFRRAVEDDQKLFQGLSFARLEALGEVQEKGFASLSAILAQQGQRLEGLLDDVRAVVVETHGAVLDLQGQIGGQSEQIQQLVQAVQQLLEQHQLQRRELRPADSLSLRSDSERQLVKQLVARYRALPENQRRSMPALLNAVGKIQVVAGDFEAAQQDFQQVAALVAEPGARAEAHSNAYRAALERRDWDSALRELLEAVKLDGKRFAPFPVGKYQPQRILGAGGFGVAFLCRHRELKAEVVIKTLAGDDLGRNVDEVLGEARVLYQLDHPAIIRVLDCGYTLPAEKARPYFVMSFFDGETLEEYVRKHGPLSAEDLGIVARQMAEGLQAAHRRGILHRDVKPANILVRRDGRSWQVKLIDFGLALKQSVLEGTVSTSKRERTIAGNSIAGTMDYAAPEQMGRRKEPAGPYSDVYGFGKTCCYALFQTTQPLPKHWQKLPPGFVALLERCLEEDPGSRPQTFADVLADWGKAHGEANDRAGTMHPAEVPLAALVPVEQPERRTAKANSMQRRAVQQLKDQIEELEAERLRPFTFSTWYRQKFGAQPFVVQALLWLLYGFIWIPVWFALSSSTEQQTYHKQLDHNLNRLKDQLAGFGEELVESLDTPPRWQRPAPANPIPPGWGVLACFPSLNWIFWIYAAIKAKCSIYHVFAGLYSLPFILAVAATSAQSQETSKADLPDWIVGIAVVAWIAGIVHFVATKKRIEEQMHQAASDRAARE